MIGLSLTVYEGKGESRHPPVLSSSLGGTNGLGLHRIVVNWSESKNTKLQSRASWTRGFQRSEASRPSSVVLMYVIGNSSYSCILNDKSYLPHSARPNWMQRANTRNVLSGWIRKGLVFSSASEYHPQNTCNPIDTACTRKARKCDTSPTDNKGVIELSILLHKMALKTSILLKGVQ